MQEGDKLSKYKFNHIHLMSPDPKKTAEFYQRTFGSTLVSSRDLGEGKLVIKLDADGVILLISKTTDEKQFGLAHFGFGADNLEKAVVDLKSNGVTFTKEITEIRPGLKISYLQAPENVQVELQEGN